MNDKKPKVLFVMHMPPPVHGSSMMGQYIHDSRLINEKYECRFLNESISEAVSDVGKFRFSKLKTLYRHIKDLHQEIKLFKPDLIYSTPAGRDFHIGCIRYVFEHAVMNHYNSKKLLHIHNKGSIELTQKWYLCWYFKMLFKNAKVIFLSDLLVAQYDKWLREDQVLICANGIPDVAGRLVRYSKEDFPKLLFLSNLIEEKGVIVLLDALKIVSHTGVDFECNFVGAESKEITKERFEDEVKKRGLEEKVHYLGKKYGEDKDSIFRQSTLFVFPTYYTGECFPLVLLEAMQYGLPCISADNGAIRQIVRNDVNGYVVPPKDEKTLAEKIITLIENKALSESFGKESRLLYEKYYTLKTFETTLDRCIQETLS